MTVIQSPVPVMSLKVWLRHHRAFFVDLLHNPGLHCHASKTKFENHSVYKVMIKKVSWYREINIQDTSPSFRSVRFPKLQQFGEIFCTNLQCEAAMLVYFLLCIDNNNLILHAISQRVRNILTAILLPMTLFKSRIITLLSWDIFLQWLWNELARGHLRPR